MSTAPGPGRAALRATALLLGLAPGAAGAGAWDGAQTGTLACGPVGSSPAFTQQVALVLRDGAGQWQGGTPGQEGFHTQALRVAPDGAVTLSGHYLVAGEPRPTRLEGRAAGGVLTAQGRRGPRDCVLRLERPAPPTPGTPFRLAWSPAPASRATAPAQGCPDLPPLPRDLRTGGFYTAGDPTASRVDPAALPAYLAAVAELRRMETTVSLLADRAQRGQAEARRCLLGLLDAMAQARSLLGEVTTQGAFERKWALVTFALAHAESRDTAAPEAAERIARWLRDYGDAVIVAYLPPPGPAPISARANNHAYWASLAALASGIAARDPVLFGWGAARLKAALGDVDPEGFLPRELAREGKALQYHRFSLEPLLLGTLLMRANGVPPDAAGMEALARLTRRVRAGLEDPAAFVARTGAPQSFVGGPTWTRAEVVPQDWAWAELALALAPDAALAARIAPFRPLRSRWLGGDLTLRHARR